MSADRILTPEPVRTIESAAVSPPVMFTEPFVQARSKSFAVAPSAVISMPPVVATIVMAVAISSVAEILTDPPVFEISISSPAAPAASISIPPASVNQPT